MAISKSLELRGFLCKQICHDPDIPYPHGLVMRWMESPVKAEGGSKAQQRSLWAMMGLQAWGGLVIQF